MKKILFSIVSLVVILTGCSSQPEELQKVTLMLDYTPNTNHTGLYVAQDQGFYEDNGIDLEIIDSSGSTPQAVSTGSADFGITYEEDVAQASESGLDNITSIYGIANTNTSGFVSYKDKNIVSPADFKGKTYCGWGSELEKALVEQTAAAGGVSPDEFTIASASTDWLRSNPEECDIFWEFEGWALQEAQINGVEYNYIPMTDNIPDEYTPIIITSTDLIDSDKDLVQSFVNATIEGYEYAAENPADAAEIFLKSNDTYDADFINKSQEYLSQHYLASNGEAGYQDPEIWDGFVKFLADNDIVSSEDTEGQYTNEFIDNYYNA